MLDAMQDVVTSTFFLGCKHPPLLVGFYGPCAMPIRNQMHETRVRLIRTGREHGPEFSMRGGVLVLIREMVSALR
jgi:hypothetical protein